MIKKFIYIFPFIFLFCSSIQAKGAPPQAKEVGYTINTFSENFTSENVDLTGLTLRGKNKWWPRNFMGTKVSPSTMTLDENDKAIIIKADSRTSGRLIASELASIAVTKTNKNGFIGTAFGGGAYFEAELSFDPDEIIRLGVSEGWPAFWGMSVEHLAQKGADRWPGQPMGYTHFAEVDFFEYGVSFYGGGKNYYGTDMHDWYGYYRSSCSKIFCDYSKDPKFVKAKVPDDTDFKQYQRYGFLWVPATDTAKGYGQHYFNGSPVGTRVSWEKIPENAKPIPDGKPWAFAILDKHHLAIILSSGLSPLRVRSVNVWQSTDSHNLRH